MGRTLPEFNGDVACFTTYSILDAYGSSNSANEATGAKM